MRLGPESLVGAHVGGACVLLGNAPSLLDLQVGFLALRQSQGRIKTIGCNRILGVYVPDYYIVCDRRPFSEYRWLIEQAPSKLLLSDTIFEERLMLGLGPQMRLPDTVNWYGWSPTTVGELDNAKDIQKAMSSKISVVQIDPTKPLHSGANISYCMLQWAMILGFHRIGLAGIDLLPSFDPKKPSHVGGGDARKGCRPAPRKTLVFFQAAAAWIKRLKLPIEIVNLSPVRGPLDKVFRYEPDMIGWIDRK